MANGDLCVNCNRQETEHDFPHYAPEGVVPCGRFESAVKHLRDCPIVGCHGNCAAMIEDRRLAAERDYQRMSHAWFISPETGELHVVDIGS